LREGMRTLRSIKRAALEFVPPKSRRGKSMSAPGKRGYICTRCGRVRRAPNPHVIDPKSAQWPRCCDQTMKLMGHRQAQAAALISPAERMKWIRLGALIKKGRGNRKWRPILSQKQKQDAYPLP
jgi:hypothetical protein